MCNAVVNRLYHHDHSGTSAKLIIIDTFLFICSIIAQIMKMYFH